MKLTITDIICEARDKQPEKVAVIHGDEQINYESLYQNSKNLALELSALGLKKNEHVCVLLNKSIKQIISMCATWLSGGVCIPIRSNSKPFQISHIINDSESTFLITTEKLYNKIIKEIDISSKTQIIFLVGNQKRESKKGGILNIPYLVNNERYSDSEIEKTQHPNDVAAILYTSGSTGMAKGVVLSHDNIISGAKNISEYLNLDTNDRILCILNFNFDYGLNQLITVIFNCAQIVLLEYLFLKDIIKALNSYKITGLAAVSATWIQLLKKKWDYNNTPDLRYITNSGGSIPSEKVLELKKRLPKTKIFLMYGFTEAFRSTYLEPKYLDKYPESIGKAVPGQEIYIIKKNGEAALPGEIGELVHRGNHVALGYWNNAKATKKTYKRNPFQKERIILPEIVAYSGDYVYQNKEGFIYFVERKDEMIKVAGNRVSPTEVEACIYQYKGIGEVIAFGCPHKIYGNTIYCALTCIDGHNIDIDDLRKFCAKKMPVYMVPEEIDLFKELPHNTNGKIDRIAVKNAIFDKKGISIDKKRNKA